MALREAASQRVVDRDCERHPLGYFIIAYPLPAGGEVFVVLEYSAQACFFIVVFSLDRKSNSPHKVL